MIRLSKRIKSKPAFDISEIQSNFKSFLRLLECNNQSLKLINELEEKSSGEYLFDMEFIRSNLEKLDKQVGEIVESLNPSAFGSAGRIWVGSMKSSWGGVGVCTCDTPSPASTTSLPVLVPTVDPTTTCWAGWATTLMATTWTCPAGPANRTSMEAGNRFP